MFLYILFSFWHKHLIVKVIIYAALSKIISLRFLMKIILFCKLTGIFFNLLQKFCLFIGISIFLQIHFKSTIKITQNCNVFTWNFDFPLALLFALIFFILIIAVLKLHSQLNLQLLLPYRLDPNQKQDKKE